MVFASPWRYLRDGRIISLRNTTGSADCPSIVLILVSESEFIVSSSSLGSYNSVAWRHNLEGLLDHVQSRFFWVRFADR